MGMLTNKNSRILIQGITGKQGSTICRDMIDFGTPVVAGVTPGKGGSFVFNIPVYNSVDEALEHHPDINISFISVPKQAALDASRDIIGKGKIKLVNVLTEGIAVRDVGLVPVDGGVLVVGPIQPGFNIKTVDTISNEGVVNPFKSFIILTPN